MTCIIEIMNRPDNPFDPEMHPDVYWRYEDLYHKECESTFFAFLLHLAFKYGWQPQGYVLAFPARDETPDEFTYNVFYKGDFVTVEDAAGLADALEKALINLPDQKDLDSIELRCVEDAELYVKKTGHAFIKHELESRTFENRKPMLVAKPITFPIESLSTNVKQYITDFIVFCRQGAFDIW